jgi:RimJ/RimL family protein N-acetyltransferase
MLLTLRTSVVRSWRAADVKSLALHANNRNIWMSVRDRFPYPYCARDARAFIGRARTQRPETSFAIAVDDEAIGGIGFQLQSDVERMSAEIGYWVGEAFWRRGIATEAVVALTGYAIETHGLTRVYALPFASNVASCRVLEKAGYVLEGHLRKSAIKDGVVTDQLQYAFIS